MRLTIEMDDPEGQIMQEIVEWRLPQRAVAITYAFLAAQNEGKKADWAKINRAITERWKGKSALERIKNQAWKIIEEWRRKGREFPEVRARRSPDLMVREFPNVR